MSTVPKTLFLRGVFIKDLVTLETLFDDQDENLSFRENSYYSPNLSSKLSADDNDECYESDSIMYDKIPKTFTTMEKWLNKTNIKCAHCSLNILGIPVPVPVSIDRDRNSQQIFDVSRVCCSFPCSTILITITIHNKSLRYGMLGMLKLIRKKFYAGGYLKSIYKKESEVSDDTEFVDNLINGDLKRGPGREELRHHGGMISIKEFRNKIWKIEFGKKA